MDIVSAFPPLPEHYRQADTLTPPPVPPPGQPIAVFGEVLEVARFTLPELSTFGIEELQPLTDTPSDSIACIKEQRQCLLALVDALVSQLERGEPADASVERLQTTIINMLHHLNHLRIFQPPDVAVVPILLLHPHSLERHTYYYDASKSLFFEKISLGTDAHSWIVDGKHFGGAVYGLSPIVPQFLAMSYGWKGEPLPSVLEPFAAADYFQWILEAIPKICRTISESDLRESLTDRLRDAWPAAYFAHETDGLLLAMEWLWDYVHADTWMRLCKHFGLKPRLLMDSESAADDKNRPKRARKDSRPVKGGRSIADFFK